ncbi:hypothetical protein FQA47_021353 [Oryzias melastigma]|uniref:Uncharacterized protein n=1 Tax=Oryzias melastigma TaxID=30732 RepID=A0A834FJL7_ORYME|nr:hypothetical protein FQA47_021353 [Oryzias melastigma]
MNIRVDKSGGGANRDGLMRELEEGHFLPEDFKEVGAPAAASEKMCWLQVDQPFLRPGESSCGARAPSPCSAAQLLASRLRRIGDQLEKKGWTPREGPAGPGSCRSGEQAVWSGRGCCFFAVCWGGFLRIAVRLTVLVLFGARPHL